MIWDAAATLGVAAIIIGLAARQLSKWIGKNEKAKELAGAAAGKLLQRFLGK